LSPATSDAWRARLSSELGREACPTDETPFEVAPDTLEGMQAALAIARESGLVVVPRGLGSKAGWCAPADADLALSTRRLAGVVSYEPGDGTVSALAGTTMSALRETVRGGGHHLTPDVPRPSHATLGGVVAAGQSGFDRLRYGPVRNALLGVRALLSGGSIAKSGGQLVKNVTGYDLHRLYCGSHGTLCVVLEASLRLHPAPEARRVLSARASGRAEALELARAALAVPARHLAVWVDRDDDGREWRAHAALAGRGEVVSHEAELVRAALAPGASGANGANGEVSELDGDAADAAREGARDRVLASGPDGAPRWPELELTARRTDLEPALERLDAAARELGLAPRMVIHPGVAQAFVRLDGLTLEHAARLTAAVGEAGSRKTGSRKAGPRAIWRTLPAANPGPAPAVLAQMRALRDSFDPDARFARGRLPGGL